MPHKGLDDTPLTAVSPPALNPSIQGSSYPAPYPKPGLQLPSAIDAGQYDEESRWPAEAFADLQALGKGVGWALAIESAAAFLVFTVWRLWRHLF